VRRVGLALLAAWWSCAAVHAEPTRVGEEIRRHYASPHPYPGAPPGTDDRVWVDEITFSGATYICPHFSRFHLSEGDYVIVRSPDGKRSWRYEKSGKERMGESGEGFWGIHIPGDTAIVELHGRLGGRHGYEIDRFARGLRTEEMAAVGPESICSVDDAGWAKCYQATEPTVYDRGRAVARLLINGTSLCTGWLVGTAGHLMTNSHCIATASDAMNTSYELMAEGATCATSCAGQLSCPGTIVAGSATLVQTDIPLDYALVLLPTNPVATYGFLRLRTTPPLVDERIYIPGHPGGKGKRISVFSTHSSDASGFCEVLNLTEDPSLTCIPSATELDVGYMCDTEGGSSGSPVLAYDDHRVVALHHCGGCPNSGVRIQNVIASLGANLPPGSTFDPQGTVRLDRGAYGCSDVIGIEVRDDNLIGQGTQEVEVDSTTEHPAESLVLTEVPGYPGRFTGSIPTTTTQAPGDGQLSVADGDTITVTYADLDDGTGNAATRMDTAASDCVPPSITGVFAINVTGNGADIVWTTTEAADSLVTYGVASAPPPSSTAAVSALATSHTVRLAGLLPCRGYVFKVASKDAAGNETESDNGGTYYVFATAANTAPTYLATGLPVAIPDSQPTGVTAAITVPDINTVQDVNVKFKVTHTYDGDLRMTLTGPGGQTVVLANQRGGAGDDFNDTVFDDQAALPISSGTAPFAGPFRPEQALSLFNGAPAAGTWTLTVADLGSLDTGMLEKFELSFSYPGQPCGPYVRLFSAGLTDACQGSGGGGGNGAGDPGEDLTIPVVLANTGSDAATSVAATLTTSTPGVTIAQGAAGYGTIGPNEYATGSVPFVAYVAASVPCGTLLTFQVDASAAEGNWVDAFGVRVGVPATTQYSSTDTPRTIPDGTTINSVVTVSNPASVTDVDVGLSIAHLFDSDLVISLIGPNGTSVSLSNRRGGSGDHYTNTVFNDAAATPISSGTPPFNGSFRPETPLSALNGIPANGSWTLRVRDVTSPDPGTLQSWYLRLNAGFACSACAAEPPSEVAYLSWSSVDSLEWTSAPGATTYSVYRGSDIDLPAIATADPDSCARTLTPATSTGSLTEIPEEFRFAWWLVRAGNSAGEGSEGSGTLGPRIQNTFGLCP